MCCRRFNLSFNLRRSSGSTVNISEDMRAFYGLVGVVLMMAMGDCKNNTVKCRPKVRFADVLSPDDFLDSFKRATKQIGNHL